MPLDPPMTKAVFVSKLFALMAEKERAKLDWGSNHAVAEARRWLAGIRDERIHTFTRAHMPQAWRWTNQFINSGES